MCYDQSVMSFFRQSFEGITNPSKIIVSFFSLVMFLLLRFIDRQPFLGVFFNWDSHHEKLNSHYKAWSYKKKKHKKIKAYRKSL